jgi:hypothetical protein
MTMNIERLTEVAEWLEAGAPERKFDMRTFFDFDAKQPQNWCGTSCCIGGYVLSKYVYDNPIDYFESVDSDEVQAGNALGLTQEQWRALFFIYDMKTSIAYRASWKDVTPAQAAKAVRNLIATGDTNWPEILGRELFHDDV